MAWAAAPAAGGEAARLLFVIGCLVAFTGLVAAVTARIGGRETLLVAVLLRLLFLPLLPGLSDDGYRYVWDGQLIAQGLNPYLHQPESLQGRSWTDREVYTRLNSERYFSVYPPVSQLVFGAAAWIGGGWGWRGVWYGIKGITFLLELGALLWLVRAFRRRGALLYAWNPLVAFEVAGQAHTEALMVSGLALMLWAAQRARARVAMAGLTAALWVKLYPLLLFPALLRRFDWRSLGVAGVLSAVVWLPFWHEAVPGNIASSLGLYVRYFEFASGPYLGLKTLLEFATGQDWDRRVAVGLQCVLVAGVVVLYGLGRTRCWSLARLAGSVLAVFLLCSTTVHPWYLLGPLFLFAAAEVRRSTVLAWIWLSAAMSVTYLRYTHGDAPYFAATALGWVGWALLLAVPRLVRQSLRRRGQRKWEWARSHLPPTPGLLLDLGAGEGHLGGAAARSGWEVDLADVVDYREVDLPLVAYDGRRLVAESGRYDATVIAFVLHHAEDPLEVLREARRVTSGPVVVIESVYRSAAERAWLMGADRLANLLRPASKMAHGDLDPQPAAVWRERFRSAGYRIDHEDESGGPWHRQHLFVLYGAG